MYTFFLQLLSPRVYHVYYCTPIARGVYWWTHYGEREKIMNPWELFTWITVVILGVGSIIVFALFVKDISEILKKFRKED